MKSIYRLSVVFFFLSVNFILAQSTAFVQWTCIPPDSQKVTSTQGNVIGLPQTGSAGFVVRSYTGSAGPLGQNQRWWPYVNGAAVSWGNETGQVNTRYVQFAIMPKENFTFHADTVSMYLGGGGTSYMRANIVYSKSALFSDAMQLNSSKIILGNNTDTLFTFAVNTDINSGDTLFVRVYPWYEGSPSTSKYLYIQDAKIEGRTRGVTYPATASWPLTDPANGGTGLSVTNTGQVLAVAEKFQGTEINQYSGPNASQRIRMAGTNNSWPANITDQIDTVYVEFAVSPKPGYTFYANSISLDMGAKSSSTFKANLWYSFNDDFSDAHKLTYQTGDTVHNYLNSTNLQSFSFSINETVISGKTLRFRVYPWNEDISVKTGKYLCLQNIIIGGEVEGNPASAKAVWPFETDDSPVTSGPVLAGRQSYSPAMKFYGITTLPRTTGGDVTCGAVQTVSKTWYAESNLTDSLYFQYDMSPKFGGTLFVDSISLYMGGWFTNNLKAAVYYSQDPSFSNKTLLIADTSLAGSKVEHFGAGLSETVNSGETFYLRIYPHNTAPEGWAKLVAVDSVVISGTTIGVTSDPPTVTTAAVKDISTTFATGGGTISTDGGAAVTARGVCWNTTGSPTTADTKTNDGTGSGSFVSVAAGLTPGTKYYLRAYAMNDAGTAYGNEVTFATLDSTSVPTVTTASVSSILVKTAQSGGTVTSWGGDTVTVRGVCWNTIGNPTVSDSKTENGSGLGSFNSILYPLEANTTYYFRAYATNSKGTGYGTVDTFKTQSPAQKIVRTVALDGTGDYTSVQAAFNDVPDYYTGPYYIKIKNGTYYEKLMLPTSKTNVILLGEDRDKTILTYDDYAGKNNLGTSGSYSVSIDADDFTAFNITFQNTIVNDGTHPGSGEQAVALSVNGDRQQYYNCNLLGYQDTYYTRGSHGTGRTYMKNCYIEGSVDFIFGRNIVVFDSCEIHINRNGGTLTAASTDAESKFGYVFLNNKITADSIGFDGKPITSFVLGRPWQSSPRTVFINCEEPASLSLAGWSTWNVTPGLYAEYNCFGPGANSNGRLKSISRQLTDQEAADYTLQNIFSKDSNPNFGFDWMPDISTITAVEKPQDGTVIPETFRLNQNYPNPFNPETTIKFSIPSVETLHPAIAGQVATSLQHVKLTVYDILGREVTTLINENKSPGNYEVKFNGAELSSGVYFYRIQAGDFVNSKKMILLK